MKYNMTQFYLDRAEECRAASMQTNLANVKKKHIDAEASWRAMALISTETQQGNPYSSKT
ncbi:hypothetical protein [Aureimonas frigidaquae]|uniref:hypothetical protein n=1 Tax=Aureimonas frigidaquae TaxID=424757 RepID=UPI000782F0E1|nr:hypothetical protein [Aureimonas frigidaquae]